METPGPRLQTITLMMKNMQFTQESVRQLKETIERLYGVEKIEVEVQKGMFRIIGKVRPRMLIRYLEEEGYKAELYMYEVDSDCESDTSENPNPEKLNFQECRRSENHGRPEKEKKKVFKKPKKKEEEEHVREPYDPVKIDPLNCRDHYCKHHKSRAIFHSKVPGLHTEDHPRHNMGHGHGHNFAGNHPIMYGSGGRGGAGGFPMLPQPYPPYGFAPARSQMPGYPNFGYYGFPGANFRGSRPFM